MSRKRRSFSKEFKARVALEALRERETLQELAKKHDLHPNQIVSWKKVIQGELPGLFSRKKEREASDQSEEIARYALLFFLDLHENPGGLIGSLLRSEGTRIVIFNLDMG